MYEDLIEHVVSHMNSDIQKYCEEHSGEEESRNRRGRIGELFTGRTIKLILLDYGFNYSEQEGPCLFWIEPQYGIGDEHSKIDLKIDIRDAQNELHTFLIEVKNYRSHYPLTASNFRSEILPRFRNNDLNHNYIWAVTLNNRHADELRNLCRRHNIKIILLDTILSETPNVEELTRAMREFTSRFVNLIRRYTDCANCREPNSIEVMEYIQRGVPDIDICNRFGITKGYLNKIKSNLKSQGIHITDRRTKKGKQIKDI